MAAQLSTAKPIGEMMKNLKVESESDIPIKNMDASRDRTLSDATSCVSSAGDASASVKGSDADHEPGTADGGMPHPAGSYSEYHYPGYASYTGAVDDKGYISSDGIVTPYPVMLADNGSFVYCMPGVQPGYTSYGSYAPVTMVNVDGQFAGQQLFPPVAAYQPSFTSHGYYPPLSYGELVPSPYMWNPSLFGVATNGHGHYGEVENSVSKALPNVSNYYTNASAKGPIQVKSGTVYQTNPANTKSNAKAWVGASKLKARSKVNHSSDFGALNEQNHGPIIKTSLSSGCNVEACKINTSPVKRDQYNLPDFQIKYDHANFFIIKSYSEDDIHKSIKYNVWSSTPNGNRKLDGAYRDAQERMAEKRSKCPVFLFFSVNASGQFCGVAEMIGSVNFSKNMDFWQQDKWTGYFPVKWHIVKDVPNPQLRHIILENNEYKPVTNSRDTQEVKFPQGTEILNIFKNYKSKTSILDDFDFYEGRQKVMQEKKIWQSLPKYNNKVDKSTLDSMAVSSGENAEQPLKDEVKE